MAAADGPGEAPTPGERKRKAGGEARDNLVAKRIRVLNGSGKLRQPLALGPVAAALSSLNMRQAIAILKGLEDKAADVPDPLAFVHTAVRDAGGVVPEPGDGMEDDEEDDEADVAPTSAVKQEVGARDFFGAKTEELTEVEKIERRVAWINRNCKLQQPLNAGEVLPALDCIGYKQSMKVLRRFQETAETVEDPDEYVRDLVARSGWIWGKPDIIDDDEKVAKRVAWLNQFGGLQQPIDFAEVADLLDGLKVAHAMVVLRELEVQSHKVEDPTAWIKQAVGSAGLDEVPLPAVDDDTAVARRISSLNETGGLSAPIEYKEVGHDLQRIGDEEALQILQEVASKGGKVKDPTGFIKFKLKAKLAALNAAAEAPVSDETKILKRVEWLNDYGGLARDIDYDKVATALENVGLDHAMTILKELEDQRQGIRDPNAFILSAVKASWKRAAAGIPTPQAAPAPRPQAPPAVQAAAAAESGTTVLKALSSFMSFVNKHPQVKKAVNFGELASALDALGPKRAVQVLQQMQNTGLGLEDPLAFVRAAAQRRLLTSVKKEAQEEEPEDDVDKITKRLKWLNQFAGLARKIRINDVVGALYCLGVPQTMEILRDLQEQASKVPDPTWFIKASVQRANGMPVGPPPPLGAADEGGEEEADGPEGEQEDDEFAGEEDLAPDLGEAGVEVPYEEEELDHRGVEEAAKAGGEESGWAGWDEEDGDDWDAAFAGAPSKPAAAARRPAATSPAKPRGGDAKAGQGGPRRVVGGISGATGKLVPTRPNYPDANISKMLVKSEPVEEEEAPRLREESPPPQQPPSPPAGASAASLLPITPQEKMLQVRELALKHNLDLDQACLRALARLPFHRAKDMIMDVVLGGRNRQGVWNPSKYLMVGCQKMTTGLGVEQGLAMELAVSLGVVLNNDALDELASIPRKESQTVIRELAKNAEAKKDPLGFIRAEVLKCRAQMDARPWPPAT